jgi:hypothetical protein
MVPWSGMNNTVVVGQLVLGLYAVYPVYQLVLYADARWRIPLATAVRRYRVGRLLAGADYASRLEVGE